MLQFRPSLSHGLPLVLNLYTREAGHCQVVAKWSAWSALCCSLATRDDLVQASAARVASYSNPLDSLCLIGISRMLTRVVSTPVGHVRFGSCAFIAVAPTAPNAMHVCGMFGCLAVLLRLYVEQMHLRDTGISTCSQVQTGPRF